MQNRIDELMELSTFELQKRALATLVAVIESDDTYDDVKKDAIKALPEVQENLMDVAEYYNDIYDEIYDNVIDDIAESAGICVCEDDCEECECEGEKCEGKNCCCFLIMEDFDDDDEEKPEFCNCANDCAECAENEKPCMGIDCPNCTNPRQDDEEE